MAMNDFTNSGCTAPTVTKENDTTLLLEMVNQIWKQFFFFKMNIF